MTDNETVGVVDQVQQETPTSAESEQAHNDRQEPSPQQLKAKDAAYNWAEARRKMQELERERDYFREEALKQKADTRKPPQEDELDKLSPDDILTVSQAQKLVGKQAKMIAEQLLKEREASTVDERLSVKYPDYRDVLSSENIEYLKQTEPELAMSLQSLAHDPYAQSVAAYKLIKKLGVVPESTPEKKKAIENSQKPLSISSVPKGTTPLGNAHLFESGLTPDLKKNLWKEMQEAKKRI